MAENLLRIMIMLVTFLKFDMIRVIKYTIVKLPIAGPQEKMGNGFDTRKMR